MAEMYNVDIWTAKTSYNTGYCQPRHSPVHETAILALYLTMNSQSASSSLGLKLTNSTVVWLYGDGVSFISPDARFGTI